MVVKVLLGLAQCCCGCQGVVGVGTVLLWLSWFCCGCLGGNNSNRTALNTRYEKQQEETQEQRRHNDVTTTVQQRHNTKSITHEVEDSEGVAGEFGYMHEGRILPHQDLVLRVAVCAHLDGRMNGWMEGWMNGWMEG